MSFYGSIYYQATDAIAKIIIKNSGLNQKNFLTTDLPDFVQLDADGRSSELRLDSGNRWIRLEGVDEENRCSIYHSEADTETNTFIPAICPDTIEIPEVDKNESSIVYPDRETVLNVEEGIRFQMPMIYYDKAGHISIPADQSMFKQTFVIPKISSAQEIDQLKNRLTMHEEVLGIDKDGNMVADAKKSILYRLGETEKTKQKVDDFLGESGEWNLFVDNYNKWKRDTVDEFIAETTIDINNLSTQLIQLSNRVGVLEGIG